MNKINVDFLFLSQFVHATHCSTEQVKEILQAECNVARNVLRSCRIETVITKEIDEQCCTCDFKSSLEKDAHEIVQDIGKALAQAQQLREKAANNIAKYRQKAKEPNVETIYTANRKNLAKKENSKITENSASSREELSGAKKNEVMVKRSSDSKSKTLIRPPNNIIPSSNAEIFKTKKNFLAVNKANIKNIKRDQKSTSNSKVATNFAKQSSDLSPLSGTSETLSSCTTSIAKLNDLMRKVSIETTDKSVSSLDAKNCPYHAENASRMVTQKVRSSVDLMEGLDRFGIQGNLVRILKIYHSYMSQEFSTNQSADKRCQRAADKFLAEFNVMNEDRREKEKTCLELEQLMFGFQSLLRALLNAAQLDFNDQRMSKIMTRYAELDFGGKSRHVQKFDPIKFRKARKSGVLEKSRQTWTSWAAHGVWNRTSPDCFPNTAGIPCIRYANKNQLTSFFKLNQRLQLFSYNRKLLDLLIEQILPSVSKNVDNSSPEFRELYKMIFTIAQVLNPRIPTLVRTDV